MARKKVRKRKLRKNPSAAKRKSAARKGAATRKRNAAKRRASARKGAATRRRNMRKNPAKKRKSAKRRTKTQKLFGRHSKSNAKYLKKRKTKRKSTKRKSKARAGWGLKSIKASRKTIKAAKRRGGKAKAYAVRHRMKTNPGAMVDALKGVAPIALTFYGSRLVAAKVSEVGAVANLLAKLPMNLAGPVMSGAVLAAVHFGTKKGALKKQRTGMMLGAAFAVIDSAISAYAPPSVASMFGVKQIGESKAEAEAKAVAGYFSQDEYVAQDDYVSLEGYTDDVQENLYETHALHGIEGDLGSVENMGSLSSNW